MKTRVYFFVLVSFLLLSPIAGLCKMEKTYHRHPLLTAVAEKNHSLAKEILEKGANPDIFDIYFNTPLFNAVNQNDFKMVQLLLEKGANPNFYNTINNNPPVIIANTPEILSLLIKYGADIDSPDNNGGNLLHNTDNVSVAKLIPDLKKRINQKDAYGRTPLHYASNPEYAQFLIENGADLNTADIYGYTPLFTILGGFSKRQQTTGKSDTLSIVDLLMKSGAKTESPVIRDLSLLKFICPDTAKKEKLTDTERCSLIGKILSNGKNNSNRKKILNDSLLILVSGADSPEALRLLIQQGADVNHPDIWGFTPLHRSKYINMTKVLLENGAKLNLKDAYGQPPILSYENRTPNHIEFLVSKGADINTPDLIGKTLLFHILEDDRYSEFNRRKIS